MIRFMVTHVIILVNKKKLKKELNIISNKRRNI
ncbi:hypothetical protein ZYGNAAKF_CDS0084 [Enterococcus phage VRE9_2]